jgi:hypothetical protein
VPILRGASMRSTPVRGAKPARAFGPLHAGGREPAVEGVVRGIPDDCALHNSLVAAFAYPAESLNPGFVEASSRGPRIARHAFAPKGGGRPAGRTELLPR